jgi:predicted HAD superfamily Cof-like phosphohydrolase
VTQATDQAHFMVACHQSTGTYNYRQACLYEGLVDEEFREFEAAMHELHIARKYPGTRDEARLVADVVDALVDLQYVCLGLGHSLGIDMDKAWAEVQRSNLSKVCPTTGRVEKNEVGKVQKPTHYSKPDLLKVVLTSWLHAPHED